MNQKLALVFLYFISLFALCLPSVSFAQQEQITITAYYPAPYAVYFELRAQRAAIGTTYYKSSAPGYCWGSGCPNLIPPDVSLIVEGKVGIGIFNPTHKVEIVDNNLKMKIGESINNPPDDGYYVYGARNTGFWTDIPANGTNASGLGMLQAGQGRAAIWYFPGDPSMPGEPKRLNITTYNGDGIRINPSSNAGNIPFTYFAPTGNVGIGTGYTPQGKLDVEGTGNVIFNTSGSVGISTTTPVPNNRLTINASSSNISAVQWLNNGAYCGFLGVGQNGEALVGASANSNLALILRTANGDRVYVSGNPLPGNVGVGTNSPHSLGSSNGVTSGNMDVNDVWIRAANGGAGQWASKGLTCITVTSSTRACGGQSSASAVCPNGYWVTGGGYWMASSGTGGDVAFINSSPDDNIQAWNIFVQGGSNVNSQDCFVASARCCRQ